MSEVTALIYLDRLTIRHAQFGGIGDGIGEVSITREAWKKLGESTVISVSLVPQIENLND